jgi:hypothetical protein
MTDTLKLRRARLRTGDNMGSPNMTSVSVSFDVRRQLNSMRAMGNHASVDELLNLVLQEYRMAQLRAEADKLRSRLRDIGQTDVEALVERLGHSPYGG